MDNPTICLNMIVKNESKIITRLFDSIIKIIDCYCICDTGSTDNTIEIIQNYFQEKNISGKIISHEFINFSYNRNVALEECLGMSDYILLLDADMIIEINFNLFDKKNIILSDYFYIFQGSNDFYYKNIRIIKNNNLFKYVGVTHEHLNINMNNNLKNQSINKNIFFIKDIGDGGCKQNKFLRDIQLLTKGILDEPNNSRYYFYLANSYYDIKNYSKAIDIYQKRIELNGWKEEIWYSYYKIGLCYNNLNNFPKALFYWLEGYNYYPERLEGLYEILKYYRVNNKHILALEIYKICESILNNPLYIQNRNNYLFLHNDVYMYKIYYEYSIISFYCGIKNINPKIIKILNNSNDTLINNQLLSNIKFYNLLLKNNSSQQKIFDETIQYNNCTFYSSSSSLIKNSTNSTNSNTYFLNIRYVNYYIHSNGKYNCYYNSDNKINIISLNKCLLLDQSFNIIPNQSFFIHNSIDSNSIYSGIEDLKLFNFNNNIYFIGTQWHTNSLGISYGLYDILNKNINIIKLKQQFKETNCEKNWVFVNYLNQLCIIYNWYPLTICNINNDNSTIEIIEQKNMPLFFSHIRGSTCSFKYLNQNWFILHIVSNETPRKYYHIFAIFDEFMNLLKYSAPFKFTNKSIEYCLSLYIDHEQQQIYINYSTLDRTTRINSYDLNYIISDIIIFQ